MYRPTFQLVCQVKLGLDLTTIHYLTYLLRFYFPMAQGGYMDVPEAVRCLH